MAKESDGKYVGKAKKRLIKELEALYKHVGELENTVGGGEWIDEALLERKLVRSAAIEEMPDGVRVPPVGPAEGDEETRDDR